MKQSSFAWLAVAALVTSVESAAWAVWGGEPDGDSHPMVGAFYADFSGNGRIEWFELICSGSYAGPAMDGSADVFLTAGHCLAFLPASGITQIWVSFDDVPRDEDGEPDGLIPAADYAFDPLFGHDNGDFHDSGVVLLPAGSVVGIEPIELPPAGFLDDLMDAGELKHMVAEVVGYGAIPTWHEAGGPQFLVDPARRKGSSVVNGLTRSNVLFLQNTQATGLDGLCFGDSGSPQFLSGTRMIISTTTGGNVVCNAPNRNYRMDTASAREFLGQFLELP
jgi:hypothetical protein